MTTKEQKSNPLIGEYFKNARRRLGYSLREVAQMTGLSHNYMRLLEDKGVSPGFESVVKLLNAYKLTIEDFSQKTGYHYVSEVKEMPKKFIERLTEDIAKLSEDERVKFKEGLKYPYEFLKTVLQGKAALSQNEVIELSVELKQPVFTYLELSGYMPAEFKALKHEATIDLLRTMGNLSPEEVATIVGAIKSMLKISISEKNGDENH